AEPVDGILTQIEALFTLQLVRTKVKEMREKWEEFVRLGNAAVEKFNLTESLPSKEIQDYESSRKSMVHELAELLDDLTRNMGSEISSPRAVSYTVPNNALLVPRSGFQWQVMHNLFSRKEGKCSDSNKDLSHKTPGFRDFAF